MSHLVIFMIVIYQISLDFYSPKTKDFLSKTRSVTCFILHLKTEWFQTLIFSKYDTVENKIINIGIFDISNVTFGNFYDCALSNSFATSVLKWLTVETLKSLCLDIIFSKSDTVENKRINIGIFDISNVTFSNIKIVCESNKYSLRTCICYLIISYSVAGRSYHLDTN